MFRAILGRGGGRREKGKEEILSATGASYPESGPHEMMASSSTVKIEK